MARKRPLIPGDLLQLSITSSAREVACAHPLISWRISLLWLAKFLRKRPLRCLPEWGTLFLFNLRHLRPHSYYPHFFAAYWMVCFVVPNLPWYLTDLFQIFSLFLFLKNKELIKNIGCYNNKAANNQFTYYCIFF